MFDDEFEEVTDDELNEFSGESEGSRNLNEQELLGMMVLYKNRLIMEAINNGLSSGFVGVCLLELCIPTLCISIPKEEVIEELEQTIEMLKDEEKFDDLQQDIDKLSQLYRVIQEDPQGSA